MDSYEIVVTVPEGLNEKLLEYARECREIPADTLRRVIQTNACVFNDHEIERWRFHMLEIESQASREDSESAPDRRYYLTGVAAVRVRRVCRELKFTADDAVALILSDGVEDIFGKYRDAPILGKLLPFRKPPASL